jgi:glycosyltransferase involved in cell wall biosynthesis
VGRHRSPPARLVAIAAGLRRWRPDVVQSAHFYTNLYAAAGARVCGARSLGAVRNTVASEAAGSRGWGPALLRCGTALVVNSEAARLEAVQLGRRDGEVRLLPNVIDLHAFDRAAARVPRQQSPTGALRVAIVGTVGRGKRMDRFVAAVALARAQGAAVSGVVVGDGPELAALRRDAAALPDGAIEFLGRRDDVPAVLRGVDALALTSSWEGFPNVLLEGMAGGLPVVTSDVGDAGRVVEHGVTGFVTPVGDVEAVAHWLALLAGDPARRRELGCEGRRRVERLYAVDGLADRLLALYAAVGVPARRTAAGPER